MDTKKLVAEMVEKSKKAQKEFNKNFDQETVDAILKELATVVYENAEELARMAVDETKMGVYEHKVKKNMAKAGIMWNHVRGKKSMGIINRDEENGIVEIAKPKGVVAAVTPCTNPIVTPLCNIMYSLKGKNSVIVAPHPRAKKCNKYTIDLMLKAIEKYNVPKNLIQAIEEPSIELTSELMKQADVIVATGGMGMVKSAYSSGKPAYGVGVGNVQSIFDRNIDFKDAVEKAIAGRIFDNGIICSGEQSVIVHEDDYDTVIKEFKANKAYIMTDPKEKEALRQGLFGEGIMNRDLVGQSPYTIGQYIGVDIPKDTKVILAEADGYGHDDLLCKEKMCPVMISLKYKDFKKAVEMAQANLDVEGAGHSANIHSNNKENIEYMGLNLTISRLIVNQPTSTTVGGSFKNGLTPTTTLGCGSWGNNSISENFDYKHLINVSRIAYHMEDKEVPTKEELWG